MRCLARMQPDLSAPHACTSIPTPLLAPPPSLQLRVEGLNDPPEPYATPCTPHNTSAPSLSPKREWGGPYYLPRPARALRTPIHPPPSLQTRVGGPYDPPRPVGTHPQRPASVPSHWNPRTPIHAPSLSPNESGGSLRPNQHDHRHPTRPHPRPPSLGTPFLSPNESGGSLRPNM